MSNPLDILFFGAPVDANYARPYPGGIDYYKREDGIWVYYTGGKWERAYCTSENDCVERPQSKPWSGPEDGLPPVGTVCKCHLPDPLTNVYRWVDAQVIWHHAPTECATIHEGRLFWCDEFRAIETPEQLAAESRESAIRELMDIAGVDCRVTAARLVDAGFKREVV